MGAFREEGGGLAAIALSGYREASGSAKVPLSDGPLPRPLAKGLEGIGPEASVLELLRATRRVLGGLYAGALDAPKDPAGPRLDPIGEILERRTASPGTRATLFGVVLRSYGVPVRFVDGIRVGSGPVGTGERHAWIEIRPPSGRGWLAVDPDHADFSLSVDLAPIKLSRRWRVVLEDFACIKH